MPKRRHQRRAQRPEMPPVHGCCSASAPKAGLWPFNRTRDVRCHQWVYRTCWNGNSKAVLPFTGMTHGIGRSGWRCFHCGEFVWDQTDVEYALHLAYHFNMLPDFAALMEGGDIDVKYQSEVTRDRGIEISRKRAAEKET